MKGNKQRQGVGGLIKDGESLISFCSSQLKIRKFIKWVLSKIHQIVLPRKRFILSNPQKKVVDTSDLHTYIHIYTLLCQALSCVRINFSMSRTFNCLSSASLAFWRGCKNHFGLGFGHKFCHVINLWCFLCYAFWLCQNIN